jgi:hypothetical protein
MKITNLNNELVKILNDLTIKHQNDNDGGYKQAIECRKFLKQSPLALQDNILKIWLSEIKLQEKNRGVYLEALSDERNPYVKEKLVELLDEKEISNEFKSRIVFSLFRMGYGHKIKKCIDYIVDNIDLNPDLVVQSIGISILHDKELFLVLSQKYFKAIYKKRNNGDFLQNEIHCFISNALNTNSEAIIALISNLIEENEKFGFSLKDAFIDYMKKPWIENNYQSEKYDKLLTNLSSIRN